MSTQKIIPVRRSPVFLIGLLFVAFQVWILFDAQQPLLQRPVHLTFALVLLFLYQPFTSEWVGRNVSIAFDTILIVLTLAVGAYYLIEFDRLTTRMENVSPIFSLDIWAGAALIFCFSKAHAGQSAGFL